MTGATAADDPRAGGPLAGAAAADDPPADGPRADDPPAGDPPAGDPSADDPSAGNPLGGDRRGEEAPHGDSWRRLLARSPIVLWGAFLFAHVVLSVLGLYGSGWPLGDVTSVYRFWSEQATASDYWVGIDADWVYPILALAPMLAAQVGAEALAGIPAFTVASLGPGLYALSWLALVTALNVGAFGVLTGWGGSRHRYTAAWWWIGFLLLLGPIALGRIDSVTVAFAVVGVLWAFSRPRVAALVLTIAAWIKVWPGAIVIAMVVASRDRWRILATAVGTSLAVAALALSFGSGTNVLSFVTEQTGRGLQVEAPAATAWMWLASAGVRGSEVYYDDSILTWQVRGPGVELASALMTPLLLLVVAVIAALGALALRRGAAAQALLPPIVLALITGMIAVQKVGSPQFVTWLAVPVILGIVAHREGAAASFRVPASVALVVAALTHVTYPYLYGYLLGLYPAMLAVLTAKNLLLLVLLAWAIAAIRASARVAPAGRTAGSARGVGAGSAESTSRGRLDVHHPSTI